MKKVFILIGIFNYFLNVNGLHAQSSFLPVNLGENVNSSYNEINPVVSPDGKTLYFNRVNHPENYYGSYNSQDVWYCELQKDGTWGPAIRFNNFINSSRYNAIIAISEDGKKLLISGNYTRLSKWLSPGLSIITKTGEEWGNPEKLYIKGLKKFIKGPGFNATISKDGSFIILAGTKRGSSKKLNLYVSAKQTDDSWSKPVSLGEKINSKYSEEAPFLTNNNETLYFSSNRPNGKGGYDIYISTRKGASWTDWSEPKLLSDTINSPGYESYFKTTKKDTYAYYVSSNKSYGGTDIYKIKLKEDAPFLDLTGKIINSVTKLPVTATGYNILVNNKKYDSVSINYDSASYKGRFRLGKKYVLMADVKNYIAEPLEIDATNIKEYTEDKMDLYVKPLPYVLVKGTFIIKSTGMIVPPIAKPKLFVDDNFEDNVLLKGGYSDSAKVDISRATYTVKLPYGKKYILMVNAPKYIGEPDTLDLTNVREYQEITRPLYAEPEREVVFAIAQMTGKVINKKTTKPLTGAAIAINVDKAPGAEYTVNTLTGEYSVKIPLGNNYIVNALSSGFYPIYEPLDLTNEKNNIKIIKDLVLVPVQVGQAVRINNIFFETGKAILNPKSFPELDKLAKFLLENPNIKVEIAGHTDNVGKPDKNMQLSRWRARSVEQYLEGKGVPGDQVTFNGYGHTKPVASNSTPKGKALNRRVEFVIKEVL